MDALTEFLSLSGIENARKIATGKNVKVMIIDTGVNKNSMYKPDSLVYQYDDIKSDSDMIDEGNHGTPIANLIQLIAPDVELYSVKVLGENGKGSPANIYKGLALALNKKVDIICLSLGTNQELSISTRKLLHSVLKSGIMVISASGNFNKNYLQNPANYDGVISVGGLNSTLTEKYETSNYGLNLDFVAVAEDIVTLNNKKEIEYRSGTSFSNAIAVGQVALIKEIYPDLTREDLFKYCSRETRDLTTGMGYLDLSSLTKNQT